MILTLIPLKPANAWLILVFHFILASTLATHHPVFQGIIPSVVPQERVSNFNAYVGTIDNLISISAPVLIGLFLIVATKKQLL